MNRVLAAVVAMVVGMGMVVPDAEARRLGGGKTLGAQRSVSPPTSPATQPAAAPAQASNPAQAAQRPGNRWLAPLAGLAAGLGLAYLFGDQLAPLMGGLLLALLVGVGVAVLVRLFGKPRSTASQGLQYAGIGNEAVAAPPPSHLPGGGIGADAPAARVPAGFDSNQFLRQAKKNFIALQAANDRGDLASIRDFVTGELFDTLQADVAERPAGRQQTDVVTLEADLLEVVTEGGMHWASIRFSGMLREEGSGSPTPFEEIWNLQKPENGSTGWMLAGIQQLA